MHGLVGIADHQGAVAAPFFGHARALLVFGPALFGHPGPFFGGVARRQHAPHQAGAVQLTLLAVQALDDGAVRGDAPPLAVDTGIDTTRIG
ncbi:hypothetical protein FQZ97_1126270 [compost metagenome]